MLRRYSMSTLVANDDARPDDSAITEWSITSSTGTSGLTRVGSPPMARERVAHGGQVDDGRGPR